jgi:hypothetical protein
MRGDIGDLQRLPDSFDLAEAVDKRGWFWPMVPEFRNLGLLTATVSVNSQSCSITAGGPAN